MNSQFLEQRQAVRLLERECTERADLRIRDLQYFNGQNQIDGLHSMPVLLRVDLWDKRSSTMYTVLSKEEKTKEEK